MTILDQREFIACQSALSWSLRNNLRLMDACLAELSPKGEAALLLAMDTIVSALRLEKVARAALLPDSLPERSAIANREIAELVDLAPLPIGVEGHAIVGGRTR